MPTVPGTIDLGKFRVVYEEEREHGSGDSDGYLLQQRAIIRLNEALVKIEQPEHYTVERADENIKAQPGEGPSPVQPSVPSSCFCVLSRLRRSAGKAEVPM